MRKKYNSFNKGELYMEQQKSYRVGEKEYSREQLIAFGRSHYPKLYWIPRVLGFIFAFVALLIIGALGLIYIILDKAGAIDAEFPTWVFFIPGGVFGMFFLAGLILIIVSCVGRSDQTYINHALNYLTKMELQGNTPELQQKAERILDQRDMEQLERNERLLKGGVITQEEFDRRKAEILGK